MQELLWIRALGLHFGTSTPAVALVVAAFMGGLGLGNLWLGHWADRSRRPLAAYAWLECAIAVTGGSVSLCLLYGGAGLDALARACARAGTWSFWAMGGVFALLMLVPATAMGGTLPLLARALVRRGHAGRTLGALYTCNTLGAIVGALLPDFVLIARWGHGVTAGIATMCHVLVALGVARAAAEPVQTASEPEPHAPSDPTRSRRDDWAALLISATTGFSALALEVLWSRTLQHWAAALATSFAVLLAVYLAAFAAGTWLSQRRADHTAQPLTAASLLLIAAAATVWLPIGLADVWRDLERWAWPRDPTLRRVGLLHEAVDTLLHATFLETGACFAFGATFPLVAAAWLRRGRAGTRTGQLFLVNTTSGVFGSLIMGFVWLPNLGEQRSYELLAVLLASVGVLCAALVRPRHQLRAGPAFGAALVGFALVVGCVLALPRGHLYRAHLRSGGEVLALEEGSTTTAAAVAHFIYGERYYGELLTPGVSMSSTRADARRYMATMAHAALLTARKNERALLICYGVGNTASALLSHPDLQQLDVVDIAAEVLALAPHFVPAGHTSPLRDPRTRVFVDDGRHHLITHDSQYDVITAEPPPPNHAGVVNLYSREFYRIAKHRLRPGGVITQWLPVFQLSNADVQALIAAFTSELPHTALLYGHREQLILIGSTAPLTQLPAAERLRRATEPAVTHNLSESYLHSPAAVLGATLQTDSELRQQVVGVEPLSDTRPVVQYPYEGVSDDPKTSYLTRIQPNPQRAFALVDARADVQLTRELVTTHDAYARAIAAITLTPPSLPLDRERELVKQLQPALDVNPDDESLWLLLAADRDRITRAEHALASPQARALMTRPRAHVAHTALQPRYNVLQDAAWVLARRAYYQHDYNQAHTWLTQLDPTPDQQSLHRWLTDQIQSKLGQVHE
ncbi:MAG: fused MFS/spermidine synthase [Polyangiales bacterium]